MTAAFRRHWRKFIYHNILHADDTPHQIALGVGIATWVALLPLIGIQTVLSLALAAALRANKAVCIPIVWITNPFTAAPIYGAFWKLGTWLTGSADSKAYERFLLAMREYEGWSQILQPGFWSELFNLLVNLGVDLWVGSAVAASLFAILAYFTSRWAVSRYRHRVRLGRSKLREARRLLRPRRLARVKPVVAGSFGGKA